MDFLLLAGPLRGVASSAPRRSAPGGNSCAKRGTAASSPQQHMPGGCVNGFSELMRDVFGSDRGVGARSAVGLATLPMNIPIEVEIILEIDGI